MKITLKFGNYVQSNNFNNILTVSNERKFQFGIAANSRHQYYRFMIGMTPQEQTNEGKGYDSMYKYNTKISVKFVAAWKNVENYDDF